VERTGAVRADAVREAITDQTVLVSVMAANNEVGTLQPVQDIGRACKERGVLFHTDAVQALGQMPIDVEDLGVELLSVSAHKVYGPKGVGALYVRRRNPAVRLEPLVYGGGPEGGLRSGTLPVPQAVGLGVACELAGKYLATEPPRLRALRERLLHRIRSEVPSVIEHGDPGNSLPGLLSVCFPALDGDAFIHCLKGVAVSQGSSCSAGSFEPSHVLRAMGLSDELARATIRMGVGRFTTAEEVDRAAELIVETVRRLDSATH
jgi:cysteine desulfurase